ncbi:Alpha/beta hydrolase family protein [Aspergillus niger]|uniref:Alpha/beta hydrolase family protein n=1 Tax=Aspergillus niger TaxID=5061 RepID=A0A505I0G7_ASPNG|nr:Alpha/beta hydrolase family protein [Aspergillus niger]
MASQLPYRRPRMRKSRGRGLRTKNGCITCRKRHLKCDEIKPICGPCVKKDKTCEYPASGRRSNDSPAFERAIADAVPVSGQEPTASPGQASAHVLNNPSPEIASYERHEPPGVGWSCSDADTNPPPPTVLDQLSTGQSPIAFQHNYLSPSNASFAAVRWFGLLASDAARDSPQLPSIENSHGTQSHSVDHLRIDGLSQPYSLQYATQVLDSTLDSGASNGPTGHQEGSAVEEELIWQSREAIELLPTEHALFGHFINQVSTWLDLFDPTSQFSTFVAHLAIYNAGLMNAILALAFRHLALNPGLDQENMPNKEAAALQYYYQTLHYVQRAMRFSSYKTSLELLATALIISAYEMLDNSTNDWERHLEGVFLIQRSQTIHGESGGLHSAVWWAWLCQDIWAAFREKRKTLTFWIPQKPLSALLPHELAMRAIYITAKVISYCAESTTEENRRRRIDDANRLRAMLEDWRQHRTVEFSPLPLGRREHSSYFRPIWIRPAAFGLAVQFFSASCILLLVHEPSIGGLDQYLERQSAIKHYVEDICGIAMTLRDNASSLMSSQAVFIAGIFTQEKRAREDILELLESCRARTGWPVRSLGVELQELWESQDAKAATGGKIITRAGAAS